jgi:divinyl protochlorophyllide a 8-vinyl-reductase
MRDPALDGRIGPNAIIRLAEAARDRMGPACCACVFRDAGLGAYLDAPPERMVLEGEVVALYAALEGRAGPQAPGIAADAGRRTADYLLAHRIPKPVQWVLKRLPPPVAARILLGAIGKHAWTFAGTGRFTAQGGSRVAVEGGPFADPGPAAEPLRAFYAAVFERLFRRLVSPNARASAELAGVSCAIALAWRRKTAAAPLPKAAQLG